MWLFLNSNQSNIVIMIYNWFISKLIFKTLRHKDSEFYRLVLCNQNDQTNFCRFIDKKFCPSISTDINLWSFGTIKRSMSLRKVFWYYYLKVSWNVPCYHISASGSDRSNQKNEPKFPKIQQIIITGTWIYIFWCDCVYKNNLATFWMEFKSDKLILRIYIYRIFTF